MVHSPGLFQSAGFAFKSVIQPVHRSRVQTTISRKLFERRVYRTEAMDGLPFDLAVDSDSADNPADVTGELPRDDDAVGMPAIEDDASPLHARDRASQDVTLLWQLFSSRLKTYVLTTLPTSNGNPRHLVLLDLDRRNVVLQPFLTEDDKKVLDELYLADLQPLELREASYHKGDINKTLECFAFHDPCKIDLIRAGNIRIWKSKKSDVEGCTTFCDSDTTVECKINLMAKKALVFRLLLALDYDGVSCNLGRVEHTLDGDLKYDGCSPASRRAYYQCILQRDALYIKGITELDPMRSQAYCLALLRGKGPVPKGLKAQEYKRIVADGMQDVVALPALQGPPASIPLQPVRPTRLPEEDHDSSVCGDDMPRLPDAEDRAGYQHAAVASRIG